MSTATDDVVIEAVSDTNDRRTPLWFFQQCAARFGPFNLDVACSAENALAPMVADDALPWRWISDNGDAATAWCNPPYGPPGTIEKWITKARHERDAHGTRTLMLLPADTSTHWFHDVSRTELIELVPFRLAFTAPDGSTKGNSAKFDSVLVWIAPKIVKPNARRA
jgi:phage N-6-adenine-methyltransferase